MGAALKAVEFKPRHVSYDYQPPVSEGKKVQKKAVKIKRKNKGFSLCFKCGAYLFVYAMILVGLSLQNAMLDYNINSIKNEINGLQTSNKRMEYKIEQLSSLERIEKVATSELGMFRPEIQHTYVVNSLPTGKNNHQPVLTAAKLSPVKELQQGGNSRKNLISMASQR